MEVVLKSAFGCLTSVLNGKSWPQALRAYRMLTAALLNDFLQDGPKSANDIEHYLENERKYPSG